jgi:predicted DNA-binding protein
MSNSKANPRYNVVSMRVTDKEKAVLDEMSRRTSKSLSKVMREAIHLFSRDTAPMSIDSRVET